MKTRVLCLIATLFHADNLLIYIDISYRILLLYLRKIGSLEESKNVYVMMVTFDELFVNLCIF